MTASTIVLIVEDKPAIAELIKYSLRDTGWTWHSVPSLAQAWDFIGRQRPQLVLQESLLRSDGGLRLLTRLRSRRHLREPVILLSAGCDETDAAATASSPPALVPATPAEPEIPPLRAGKLVLDPLSCSVHAGSHRIEVRQAEYRLLRFLLTHPGKVFSRTELLEQLWDAHERLDPRTVDVHVLRLRKALGRSKNLIKTVRGAGYMLLGG
jgi:two-component system phosphate regulon response regulator PhoB